MSKPIIRWMGGKSRLAKTVLPLFPKHTAYIEPFCGGAALFFRKPPAKCEVLNDINGDLMNLYRVVQHHCDEFVRQFDCIPSSRELFEQWLHAPTAGLTDIQRAVRFYYIKQNNFGGKDKAQNYGYARTGASNYRHGKIRARLGLAHKRLCGVFIENLPWQEVFARYDATESFFYCDPPYYRTSGYGTVFPLAEYQMLAEIMRTCKGKVLLSINNHEMMREIFAGFAVHEVQTTYTLDSNSQQQTELLVANYDMEVP